MTELDTLPKLLQYNYQKYGSGKIALREKDFGIWQHYTWSDYYEKVKYFSLGLASLGLKAGDKVSIIGENKPQWYWAELAAQALGSSVVGIFPDCNPSEIKYYLQHSDSVFLVVDDQEQVDKVLQIKAELPLIKKLIYWDPKGLWSYQDSLLLSFDRVINLGREYEKKYPEAFEKNISEGKGDDPAVICYTSGTTGLPKGAMLNHRWLIEGMTAWANRDDWAGHDYQYLSFIPPAWSTEQGMGIAGSLSAGVIVNFPEEPETVQDNIREIGPHILFYGARLWESLNRMVQAKILDTSPLKRFLYHLFLPVGYKIADGRINKKSPHLLWRLLYYPGNLFVFRPLRDKLGLSNVKVAYSAGAALSPEIIRFFLAMGITIRLYYGTTEAGLVSMPTNDDLKPESSGKVVDWAQLKLSEEGEILVKSKYMFSGYYKAAEATQKKFRDGWYTTGDFGHIDKDDHLIVIDRMEDLKELSGGRKFSPQYTEIRLRFSPYIKDALVVGGKERDFVTALINFDLGNVGRWAEANRITYTTFTDLSQKSQVIELICQEVDKVNSVLPEWTRIRTFINLHKEFDADEAELTRTRKIRRSFVEERYKDLIEAMYSNLEELKVETVVTYQDGKKGLAESVIKVNRTKNGM